QSLPKQETNRVGTARPMRARPAHDHLRDTIRLSKPAEEEGFEPPELALGGFQDRCLRPLGHSSRRVPEVRGEYRNQTPLVKRDRKTSTVAAKSRCPATTERQRWRPGSSAEDVATARRPRVRAQPSARRSARR